MGLDMYLSAREFLSEYDEEGKKKQEAIQKLYAGTTLADFLPYQVSFEVMYWRKANAIHSWFVTNVQDGQDDCGSYTVSLEKLMELREIVTTLAENRNVEEAMDLLPPQAGFFFGDANVDEWYWYHVDETKECLDKLAKKYMYDKLKGNENYRVYFEYHASW